MTRFEKRRTLLVAAACSAVVLTAGSSRAQCGASSSCRQCHEVEEQRLPSPEAPWHVNHRFGDFCANCHGGDPSSADVTVAHVGLVDPLAGPPAEPGARCRACHEHPEGLAAAYAEYRSPRGGSSSAAPPRAPPVPPRADTGSRTPGNLLFSTMTVVGGMVIALLLARDRRKRLEKPPFSLGRELRRPEWSPYTAGALLGLVVTVAMTLFGHRLSGGGAYQQVAAVLGRVLAPHSVYFNQVVPRVSTWELACVFGALLGAFAAAKASGRFRVRAMPDAGWEDAFGSRLVVRWLVGFIGAGLTEFAAGVAGGCTASLALSGGAALAPGAFAFMGGMFAGGIPVAWLVHRRRGA